MLYIAIPAHNEVETIGVLLWRLRTVLAEFPREYEIVVYDDASTDSTREVLASYSRVLPLTVIGSERQVGYARAVDALLRHTVRQTRHPRRDAVLLLQADFTDPPGLIPEFARSFEGGADIVNGERTALADAPRSVNRLFRFAGWSMRPFVRVDGVRDVTSSLRLVRIAVVRDLLRERGEAPLCDGDSWTANADLLLRLVPFARRIETVPVQPTYGVRMRDTRRVAMRDGLAAFKWAWGARNRRVASLPGGEQVEAARPREEVRLTLARTDEIDERPPRQRDLRAHETRAADARIVEVSRDRKGAAASRVETGETKSNEPAERRRKRKRRTKRSSSEVGKTVDTLSLFDPESSDDDVMPRADAASALEDSDIGEENGTVAEHSGDVDNDPGDLTGDAERVRKRRRRRKRSRRPGANGTMEIVGEGVETDAASANGDGMQREFSGLSRDDDPYAPGAGADLIEADGDSAAESDVAGADGSEGVESGEPRSRRRGRRGRRGGRRSRSANSNGEPSASGTETNVNGGTEVDARDRDNESPE